MTKNITLAVDDEVLSQVSRIAAERNTSVNALVSEYLTHLAKGQDQHAAWDWLAERLEPGLRAADEEFVKVSADDVVVRNRRKAKAG